MFVPLVLGVLLGILAGLLPGLHPNTISQLLSSVEYGSSLELAIVIVLSSAVNNIVALIPAIFFFIPDSDSVLSILPAQKLVKAGKGRLAVRVCAVSALLSLLFLVLVLPLSYFLLPALYELVKPFLGYALILFSLVFIFQEFPHGIGSVVKASLVFMLAGTLGILLLDTPLSSATIEPLFVVFVGFFALSSIILSFSDKSFLPAQKKEEYRVGLTSSFLLVIFTSVILGCLADLFPAINSSAQLATFISPLAGTSAMFLASTTSITVSHYANSLVAFDTIGKARTGTIVNIQELIGEFNIQILLTLVAFYFIGTGLGIVLLILVSEAAIKLVNSIDQKIMNVVILLFLVLSVLMVSGMFGLLVCVISTAIGLLPPLLGVRRTHLMAFLIVPSILFLL